MSPRRAYDSRMRARASPFVAYGLALLAAAAGVALSVALLELVDQPVYAPLVVAVAVTAVLGGARPAIATIAAAWLASLWLLVGDRGSTDLFDEDGFVRWAANLVAALAIVAGTELLRARRDRATLAAQAAEATADQMAALQDVAGTLASVATTTEIANALVTRLPAVVGARGAAVGLLVGDDLVVVDPQGGAFQVHPPGSLLPLSTQAPITRATDGEVIVVRGRRELERAFPDGAATTPGAEAVMAAPLTVRNTVAGAMTVVWDRAEALTERAEAIVRIAADLGGQALERGFLYEREVETRNALDRLLRVAPRFHTEDPADVVDAICREARRTFESDFAVLWRLRDSFLELLASDPASDALPRGLEASLPDFPRLLGAVGRLQASFVPDVQEEARGGGADLVRRLGIRSSLRVPIAISGKPELLLSLSFRTVVPEPSPSTTLVARRFADHAGLAFEQLERRRAEAEAQQRAEEARRLHEVTASLAAAATTADVCRICLEHSLAASGARAGLVALRSTGGLGTEVAADHGLAPDELPAWRGLAEHLMAAPTEEQAEALRLVTGGEASALGEAHALEVGALAVLGLEPTPEVAGRLVLRFDTVPELDEETTRWLESVVSQCAQALERTRLLDEERRQRRRAEVLQRMTTRLSSALSLADVAEVAVDEAGRAADAAGGALAVTRPGRQLLSTIAWQGYSSEAVEPWLEIPLDDASPGTEAILRRRPIVIETRRALRRAFPDLAGSLLATGHESFLFVPLVVGHEAKGVLVLSWTDSRRLPADQLALVQALAAQAAQAIDRASHFEWERSVAETLQRSVLPGSLPEADGVVLAARYLPGTAGLDVGGDWFDAIQLPDEKLGLVVGDVVGKGVSAASNMAQLRNALRAFSLDRLKPSSALARLNRLAHEVLEDPFATVAYAVLDPDAGTCRIASAGHPPAVVAYADGRVEFLEGAQGLPLGADPETSYTHEVVKLPTGAVLVLYTDGLVERRDRPIDDGLQLLREALGDAPTDLEELVDHVLDRLVGSAERADDIAILAVQLLPVAPRPFHLATPVTPQAAKQARHALRSWLTGTPLEAREAEDVVLSVWEACANAVEHGGRGGATRVVVEAEIVDDVVRVRVEDDGRWSPGERERGHGLKLMGSLMSSASVTRTGRGTKVTLERRTGAGQHEPAAGFVLDREW